MSSSSAATLRLADNTVVPIVRPDGARALTSADLDAVWRSFDVGSAGSLSPALATAALRDVLSRAGAEFDELRAGKTLAPLVVDGKVSRAAFDALFVLSGERQTTSSAYHLPSLSNAGIAVHLSVSLSPGDRTSERQPCLFDALPCDVLPLILRHLFRADLQAFAACSRVAHAAVNSSAHWRLRFLARWGEPKVTPPPGASWSAVYRARAEAELLDSLLADLASSGPTQTACRFLPLPDLDDLDMCLMLPMPSPGLSSQSTLLPPGVSRSEFEDDLSALEELMRS